MAVSAQGGHGPAILAVGWLFAAIAGILLAMRVYVRLRVTPHGTWALAWTVVAYTTTIVETICATIAVRNGLGNHLVVIEEAGKVPDFLFWTWMTCFWFDLNVGLSKVAAASFLVAVHEDAYPRRRYLLVFIGVSNMLFAIPDALLVWLQCSPSQALWNPLEQDRCTLRDANVAYTRFLSVWSAASDIAMVILPILVVANLQIRLRTKVIICFLMGLGLLAAVAALMVAYYVKDLASPDVSYDLTELMLWGKVAGWLVIISTSVPPVAPLFKKWLGGARPSQESKPSQHSFIQLREQSGASQQQLSGGQNMKITKQVHMEERVDRMDDERMGDDTIEDIQRAYLGRGGAV